MSFSELSQIHESSGALSSTPDYHRYEIHDTSVQSIEELPSRHDHDVLTQDQLEAETVMVELSEVLVFDMISYPQKYLPYYLDNSNNNKTIKINKYLYNVDYRNKKPADINGVKLLPHKTTLDPSNQDFCENQWLIPMNYYALAQFKKYLSPEDFTTVCTGFRAYSELGKAVLPSDYEEGLIDKVRSDAFPGDKAESCRNQGNSGACYAVTMTNMLKDKEGVKEQYSAAYIDFCNYYDQLLKIYESGVIPKDAEGPGSKTALVRGGDNLRCFEIIAKYGISRDMQLRYIPRQDKIAVWDRELQGLRDSGQDESTIKAKAKGIINEMATIVGIALEPDNISINTEMLAESRGNAREKNLEHLGSEYINIICNPNKSNFSFQNDFDTYSGNMPESQQSFNLSPFDYRDLITFSLERSGPVLFGIDAYEPFFNKKEPDDKKIPPLSLIYVPKDYLPSTDEEASERRILEVEGQFTTSNHAIVGERIISYHDKDFILCKDSGGGAHADGREFTGYRLMDLDYYLKITNYTIQKDILLDFLKQKGKDTRLKREVRKFSYEKK